MRLATVAVDFEVRGLIQLNGTGFPAPFPEKVEGIQVKQKCRSIHFLLGTVDVEELETEIGHYEVQFADGQRRKIPIVYGKDVLDLVVRSQTARRYVGPTLRGRGTNRAAKAQGQGNLIRLYHMEWENPLKDVEITSISFVSAMTISAPFLIAITLD